MELEHWIGEDAAGAVISSTEMMIYELLRGSGAEAFKEMLKHLK